MADAKECDRCGNLYKEDTTEMPYEIYKRNNSDEQDLCPECSYELEEWFTDPNVMKKGKKKKKVTYNVSPEAREKKSEYMKLTAALAKAMAESEDLTYKEAFSNAATVWKERGKAFVIKQTKFLTQGPVKTQNRIKEEKSKYCSVCLQNKTKEGNEICEECFNNM